MSCIHVYTDRERETLSLFVIMCLCLCVFIIQLRRPLSESPWVIIIMNIFNMVRMCERGYNHHQDIR